MPPCAAFIRNPRSYALRLMGAVRSADPVRSAEPVRSAVSGGLLRAVVLVRSRLHPAVARTIATPNTIDTVVTPIFIFPPVAHPQKGHMSVQCEEEHAQAV